MEFSPSLSATLLTLHSYIRILSKEDTYISGIVKKKLTLTVEQAIVKEAKLFAYAHNVSLSQIVEDALAARITEESSPLGDKWKGRFRLSDKKDARTDYLLKRHR